MQGLRFPLFTAALLGMALTTPAGAEIFKWVDEKGVTHYGEKAPEGVAPAKVKVSDTTSSDAEDEIKRLEDRRAASRAEAQAPKGGAASPSEKTPAANDTRTRNTTACEQHRKNLEALQSGKRIRLVGEDGKARALDDETRAAQLKFAQDELARCEQLQRLQESASQAPLAPPARR
ncbi:MAG: DUF4124 domain-containing protein [Pseudomonadota bacterium]